MDSNQRIVDSKVKCKCGSIDIFLSEVWEGHCIVWEQLNGKFDRSDGSLEPGSPKTVEATCKRCNRMWRIRGASQIDDVIPETK